MLIINFLLVLTRLPSPHGTMIHIFSARLRRRRVEVEVEEKGPSNNQVQKMDEDEANASNVTLGIGDEAPDFELLDSNGNRVRLSSFKGQKVLLSFARFAS